MGALETLQAKHGCQMLFVENGGDNLAANYPRELADCIVYMIDVSGSIRSGMTAIFSFQCQGADKNDLAPFVNTSLEIMDRDSKLMRGGGPMVLTSIKEGRGVDDAVDLILGAWRITGSPEHLVQSLTST